MPALLPQAREQRPRPGRHARHRRPPERHLDQDAASAGRRPDRRGARARPAACARLQYRRPGRRGLLPADNPQRPPLLHRRGLPASGARPRQPAGGDRRARHGDPVRGQPRLRRALSAGRPGAHAAGPPRGDPVRRRAAIAATAAIVGRGPGRAAAALRHRRGARPARRGREPAGPPADPAHLRDAPPHHHQRPAAHAARTRGDGAAMAAVPRRAPGGGHQPGRPVLPRRSGQRHARHPVSFRHAVGRHGRRQGASILGLHLFGVPAAALVARHGAVAQLRPL
ncbi:Uncharacterised protein [Achromobacter xylosoxidans]|nr:Uncharacterised protein [Achromobacter xylosoxidans]